MELSQVMRTTPATRAFVDAPLSDQTLYEILDRARFAPNGGNRQSWHVIVVRDPAVKRRISELYDLGMREYMGYHRAGLVPFAASEVLERYHSGGEPHPGIDLAAAREIPLEVGPPEYMATAPVLLVITLDLTNVSAVDSGLGRLSIAAGGSVYPFAHNILLAARDLGFGGHVTSVLARQEPELRKLLGIPEQQVLATMIPLGKPEREITRLRRNSVEEFTTAGTADGPAFTRP
ncbi:MAG TPA: nitroreductase family protein [Acidimicrobiales bacterium]|nr:nitroreductase family protein [Acidimicrobiales bacterium]